MTFFEWIPAYDHQAVWVAPWQMDFWGSLYVTLTGMFIVMSCGWVGAYLILRRLSLVGDAISHSVLPGLVIALLIAGKVTSTAMFLGALTAGVVTTALIEFLHGASRTKPDAAIGVSFTFLFALGVILVNTFAGSVDLDADCVLHGELIHVAMEVFDPDSVINAFGAEWPITLVRMAAVTFVTVALILIFYKELLVSSFDAGLASALGFRPRSIHYGLMIVLSWVIVSAFESVGAILVIAMLILPGATAYLWVHRLPWLLILVTLFSPVISLGGYHMAVWLNCSVAAAMALAAAVLFVISWIIEPRNGLIRQAWARWKSFLAMKRSMNPEPSIGG